MYIYTTCICFYYFFFTWKIGSMVSTEFKTGVLTTKQNKIRQSISMTVP